MAYVRFADGLIMFAEYDGTADWIIPQLYESRDALSLGWRKSAARQAVCTCGKDEPAEYAETYGDGSHGPLRACRHCKAITDTTGWMCEWMHVEDAGPTTWQDGTPSWLVEAEGDR
jgi:hypothetical protein